jgi:hypothetical protein
MAELPTELERAPWEVEVVPFCGPRLPDDGTIMMMAGKKRKDMGDDDMGAKAKTKEDRMAALQREMRAMELAVADLPYEPARVVAAPFMRAVMQKAEEGNLQHHLTTVGAHGLVTLNEVTSNNEDTRIGSIMKAMYRNELGQLDEVERAVKYVKKQMYIGATASLVSGYSAENGRVKWEDLQKEISTALLRTGAAAGAAAAVAVAPAAAAAAVAPAAAAAPPGTISV